MKNLIKIFLTLCTVGTFSTGHAQAAVLVAKEPPYGSPYYEKQCSNFSQDMQQFSDKLNDANLKIFCSEFNDTQRKQAMQMTSQMKMTPDQSVEMVAKNKKH